MLKCSHLSFIERRNQEFLAVVLLIMFVIVQRNRNTIVASLLALMLAVAPLAASNGLESYSSPYLQLHSTDPVKWRQWTQRALEEARQTKRPIFLSIGYLACHWCHVMQKESFTDPKTAEILNTRYIPILVDREARPDVDELFQELALRLGIQTGWPLNMMLTPDGHPFFGGVYFPPESRAGILSFREILTKAEKLYQEDPKGIAKYASLAIERLSRETKRSGLKVRPSRTELQSAINQLAVEIDDFNGGFGDGAKFPRFPALLTLWRGYLRSGDEALAKAVTVSISAMINSAIMDQVGGGFFRYTIDPLWRQPHFEKMLDVNAMAVIVMTEVWQETRDPHLAKAVQRTIDFLLTELQLPTGAFSSALDADSEDSEGAFYVWDAESIQKLLGADYRLFEQVFVLAEQEEGVEGFALHRSDATQEEIASNLELPLAQVQQSLSDILDRLKKGRSDRPRPARDEKIIASWNALAVSALVNAGMAFERPDWVNAGRRAFQSTLSAISINGVLYHSSYDGRQAGPANLEDRAFLARAAIDLFMAEGNDADLAKARTFLKPIADYEDSSNGGYFMTTEAVAENLPRLRTARDSSAASGNAALGDVLASLYYLTGESTFQKKAERLVTGFSEMAMSSPLDLAGMITTADLINDAIQIVIVADPEDQNLQQLVSAAWQVGTPGRIFQIIAPGAKLPDSHPAQYKYRIDDKATAYVCVGQTCSLPNTDAQILRITLKEFRRTWK